MDESLLKIKKVNAMMNKETGERGFSGLWRFMIGLHQSICHFHFRNKGLLIVIFRLLWFLPNSSPN